MRSLFWCLSLLADPSIEWTGAIQSKLGRKKDKFRRKQENGISREFVVNLNQRASTSCSPRDSNETSFRVQKVEYLDEKRRLSGIPRPKSLSIQSDIVTHRTRSKKF
ncbi:Oidioi.mRNA.OKI2018_I69.chr2.g4394.t1.cds [Oikopleura dioica]|uniref:Oidioi.mRNA.OKI2018_I69.chr2.g4394.t1.cds n=1 Tax=Oikopleura dioica TaxID=34765 RepID=A0ABN7T699_OIKDI|nr:Oidioi.mRNA.OKI2018_I69.chr2.g4394.t1.cds [Oikopleura dioica]